MFDHGRAFRRGCDRGLLDETEYGCPPEAQERHRVQSRVVRDPTSTFAIVPRDEDVYTGLYIWYLKKAQRASKAYVFLNRGDVIRVRKHDKFRITTTAAIACFDFRSIR